MQDEYGNLSPDGLGYWTQVIDGAPYGCWYRLRADGHVEVLARGHRVVLPIEALALLPESIARAVLAKMQEARENSRSVAVDALATETTTFDTAPLN